MKAKHYIITGLVTYALFLIISVPASLIIGLLDEKLPQLDVQGVNGTLWNGSAQRVNISSMYKIEDMKWTFCTWRLITAEACINMDALYENRPLQAQLGVGLSGTIHARDLNAEIDARSLGDLSGLPVGELSGLIAINLETASWKKEQVPGVTGSILWKNAGITIAETADLGEVKIILVESDSSPLAGTISNKGGNLILNGNTNITGDGAYNLELKLLPNETASNNLRASLKMLAKQQNDGSFVLNNTGNLKQFGIM